MKHIVTLILLLTALAGHAQFTLTGQVRTRTEYRDGVGTLRPKQNKPAFFTSQRSRLTFNYKMDRIVLQASVQDVRVWGQDASTISNADGSRLALHEGWADIILSNKKDTSFANSPVEYFSVKIGRQELLYDDSRLLGNLDWLQQARRHDAIVFKLLQSGWQVDLGAAFNQNTDAFNYSGTYYAAAKNYKAMQFLYAAKSFGAARVSYLFFSDQFSKLIDSVKAPGVNARFTTGLLSTIPVKKFALTAGAWWQEGAWMSTLALAYAKSKWTFTAGWDHVENGFDPLYGTPHKFWGYMDYFYVGTGAPKGGLSNPYFKIKYSSANKRFTTGLDYHYFMMARKQESVDRYLGSEIDWISSYSLNKYTNLELGIAYLAASKSMEYAKNITPGTAKLNAQWAYLQVNIRPEFLIK